MQFANGTFGLMAVVAAMAFLPIVAVSVTAFAKISVVIFIVRNALGIQQLPPNIVVYALAVILSAFIARPIAESAYQSVARAHLTYASMADWEEAADLAKAPLKDFLVRNADARQTEIFVKSTAKIWPEKYGIHAEKDDLSVLAPAFMLTQLTNAFEIGFMLYLPFMAIDIIVTSVLIALGMMMISPSTIAIPFKLMLFVFVEGWTKIVEGLLLTYS